MTLKKGMVVCVLLPFLKKKRNLWRDMITSVIDNVPKGYDIKMKAMGVLLRKTSTATNRI